MPPRAEIFLLSALLILVSPVSAAPLFADESVLRLELAGPLSALIEQKESRTEYPFVLRANGVDLGVKVRVRGHSRVRVCGFPPLRLNFAKHGNDGTPFEGQDKLKLVTQCKASKSYQGYLLKEYAAYKIFNIISDVGYKVRLARIIYTDTDGKRKDATFEQYGFLIESAAELAARTNGQTVHTEGITLSSLNVEQAARVFVFQYLVGNTDWSLALAYLDDGCCHNGDLVDIESERYYVPYDFDLTGLVNARYAKPDNILPISRVTHRLYRGHCISPEAIADALRAIKSKKDEILGVIGDVPGLTEKESDRAIKYLDGFFDQADDEKKLLKNFARRCI